MGVLGSKGPNALKYYGSILNSAYAHANTHDMWVAIHDTQAQYGLPKPGADAIDVGVIRGYANRIVAGANQFAAANATDTITAGMMAVAPYTDRDLAAIATEPVYHVRYWGITQAADGQVTGRWNISVMTATQFPDTVGGLRDALATHHAEHVAAAAQETGGESGGTSLGISNIEITLV